MISRFKTVLIAALLGILPYFLFIGGTNTATVNGVVVRDEQFNLLGIVCALIGLWLVFTILRRSAPKDMVRKALGVVAGLLCLLQLAASIDIVRPLDWFNSESDMPPLAYSGLIDGNRDHVEGIVARGDLDEITRNYAMRMGTVLSAAQLHMDYADVCFSGRYRLDHDALVGLMDALPEEDQQAVLDEVEAFRRPAPQPEGCGPAATNYAMRDRVDTALQNRDMIEILRDGYVAMTQ